MSARYMDAYGGRCICQVRGAGGGQGVRLPGQEGRGGGGICQVRLCCTSHLTPHSTGTCMLLPNPHPHHACMHAPPHQHACCSPLCMHEMHAPCSPPPCMHVPPRLACMLLPNVHAPHAFPFPSLPAPVEALMHCPSIPHASPTAARYSPWWPATACIPHALSASA